jgi:hypothetical protein
MILAQPLQDFRGVKPRGKIMNGIGGAGERNSKSIFFSRNTIAARWTHGHVLKLTSKYFAILLSGHSSWGHHMPEAGGPPRAGNNLNCR